METNLTRVDDLLLRARDPDAVAIIYEGKRYRYRDLYQGMMNIAARLTEFHLFSDEMIIVHLGNRPEAIMAMMAISYTGNTFIPVPDTIKAHRLAEIIEDCGAKTIITDEKRDGVLNHLGDSKLALAFNIDEIPPFDGFVARSKPGYPAALMYTSGTTGKPKGVMCPHHKIMAAVSSINAYLLHTSDDIIATALPLSHGYGLYQVLTLLEAGGRVLLEPNFSFPEQTLIRIREYKATGFAAAPSMIHMIMQREGWEKYLSELQYLTTAGAALPPTTFEKLKDVLSTTQIVPMYGQTECVRALYYPSFRQCGETRLNSCGIPIPDTKVKVMNNGKVRVGDGELWVKSPHVMDGYWNDKKATEKAFYAGWLLTGDRFGVDKDGLYYYVGRMDEVVKIKGERCAPQELDNGLLAMPEIDEAASFTVKDRIWGHRFVSYVMSKDYNLTTNDVKRYCRRELEHFLMPKDVVIVNAIPKNENGKVSRQHLKAQYEAMREQK